MFTGVPKPIPKVGPPFFVVRSNNQRYNPSFDKRATPSTLLGAAQGSPFLVYFHDALHTLISTAPVAPPLRSAPTQLSTQVDATGFVTGSLVASRSGRGVFK